MSEPVAADFGLEPRNTPITDPPPISSRDLVSEEDYREGSEFGGVDGLIQPPPHVPDASERLMMLKAIDPTDPGDRDDSVVAPELEGLF